MRPSDEDPPVRVEKHRAERLADFAVVGSVCCSSCCCCCCCVHAIGGVVGAAAGSAMAASKASNDPEAARGVAATNVVYWIGFIVVAVISVLLGLVSDHVWESLLVVALGAPFFQLGLSLLALLTVAAQPPRRRDGAVDAVIKMTVGGFVGAIAGTLLMVALGAIVGALGALVR